MTRLGVLASGRGSNFVAIAEAICRGELKAEIALLISDRKDAPALARAAELGIGTVHLPYSTRDREAFERAAGDRFDAAGCALIILAGYMRLLTPYFVRRYPGRILNIHPSLLPAFRGLHAQRQALEFGVKIAGCTVHVVTEELDAGPILGQRAVPVLPGDTEESLPPGSWSRNIASIPKPSGSTCKRRRGRTRSDRNDPRTGIRQGFRWAWLRERPDAGPRHPALPLPRRSSAKAGGPDQVERRIPM